MKLKKSVIAILALSGISFAGGDIGGVTTFENEDYVQAEAAAEPAVVEPVAAEPVPVAVTAEKLGLYIGGAFSRVGTRLNDRVNLASDETDQDRQYGLTGVIGYDFMDYLGAEMRATMGLTAVDEGNKKFKQVGAYLKPNIDVMDALNLYGLVGYSKTNMSDAGLFTGSNTGLSYGAGVNFDASEDVSVFADMVNYLKDEDTNSQWGASLGLKYNF